MNGENVTELFAEDLPEDYEVEIEYTDEDLKRLARIFGVE